MVLSTKLKVANSIGSCNITAYTNGFATDLSIQSSKSHLLGSRSSRSISSVG
jgi:hypothetical protein